MIRKLLLLTLLALSLALSWQPTSAKRNPNAEPVDEADYTQRQFVRALDAAWIRVLQNDDNTDLIPNYRDILNDPQYASVLAGLLPKEHVKNLADCLPEPDVIPFPTEPEGLLERVIETGQVNVCRVGFGGPPSPLEASDFFKSSGAFEDAIWATLETHYGIPPVVRNSVFVRPPFDTTTPLNTGACDYLATGNALGGATTNFSGPFPVRERRRDARLHTCTISASGQFIHVPDGRGIVIDDVDDLIEQTDLRICTGNLSTQLANQYFGVDEAINPDRVATARADDIQQCDARILADESDVIIMPLPDLAATGAISGDVSYTAVDTNILAGTPYWVAPEVP